MNEYEVSVDARGKNCPLPILYLIKALGKVELGQIVQMVATDPGSVRDVETLCRRHGHELVSFEEAVSEFVFLVRKRA